MATEIKAKSEYTLKFSNLTGGINLWDPEHQLSSSETAEMKNLLWENGMLVSRKGQKYLSESRLGTGYALYPRMWHGGRFAHIGTGIYVFDADGAFTILADGIPEVRGTFFLYDEKLYYKTSGAYKVITYDGSFSAADVVPYVPVILINAAPSTAAGDVYQPENRLSARKTVWYNAVSGVVSYYLPVCATKIIDVYVDGVRTTAFSYNSQKGLIKFTSAPPVTDPPTNNTVKITYELANAEAYASIDECRYVETYGGTGALCIVMAGYSVQPNAYYWNGQDSISMNPGYFPVEQVQLAGDNMERVTGFGKQQSDLVVFKEHSVGKTTLGTVTLNDRLSIDMPYTPVNAKIGCVFPWSIQLVQNNLVWANAEGIYTMLDTTAADENSIVCISRKIRGDIYRVGLVIDLASADEDEVCSVDDDRRYYITANAKTWCWDYQLSEYTNPSWFLLTNTDAVALGYCEAGIFHLNAFGQLSVLQDEFNDYGEAFERVYRFAIQNFGSYDCHKNVNTVIITLGAWNETRTKLQYISDYELRADLTDLVVADQTDVFNPRAINPIMPAVFRRAPHCLRVMHFGMRLVNENIDQDLEIVGAEVFYTIQGRLR